MNSDSDSHSLLAIAITETLDQSETCIDTKTLFDSGSQFNFITTSWTNRLNLKMFKQSYQIYGLKGMNTNSSKVVNTYKYKIRSTKF